MAENWVCNVTNQKTNRALVPYWGLTCWEFRDLLNEIAQLLLWSVPVWECPNQTPNKEDKEFRWKL